jgi:two-component system, chemotaxis family, chemotaxis protein CheY
MADSLLIVDDSVTMRMIIKRTLRAAGLSFERTDEAANGKEAVEKLRKQTYSIMLCDINMPEMSGSELVKQVRQITYHNDMQIIMISTESSQELIDQLLADGANDYIGKPFTADKFRDKLSPLVASS